MTEIGKIVVGTICGFVLTTILAAFAAWAVIVFRALT